MAFTSDITLTGNSVSNTVSAISVQGSETVRRDAARGLATPYTFRISTLQRKVSGGNTDNSHLARIDHTFVPDATKPTEKRVASVYVTVVRPDALSDTTIITTMVEQLKAFLTSGNLTKLLNGES